MLSVKSNICARHALRTTALAVVLISFSICLPRRVHAQDPLRAAVDSAIASLERGDTTRAVAMMVRAYAIEPCLVPDTTLAPVARWREIFAWASPKDQSCNADVTRAMLTSTLVPGLGQLRLGRTSKGFMLGGVAVLGVATGVVYHARSQRTFDQYERAGSVPAATELHARAERQRTFSATALLIGGAAWLYNIYDARQTALERADELIRVRPYAHSGQSHGLGIAIAF